MPRSARKHSETNLYHVMLRGNGQRQIFQDAEDNEQFITTLEGCKIMSGFEVYAYCLMGNHAHLLMRVSDNGEPLSQIFRRFGAQYVYWYNGKYRRVGHLFQDRYKSEVVEDETNMLTVLRYIHMNPVKAGIVKELGEYPYSSYREYLNPSQRRLTDVEFINGIMDQDHFIRFHQQEDDVKIMDIQPIRARLSDEQVKKLIEKTTGCRTVDEFQELSKVKRIETLKKLKKKGVSYRQLSRLTGESVGIVQRA